MKIYDTESLLSDIQALYASKLNTKIAAINSEKSDSIVLKTVDTNAYFQELNGKQVNFDPFILYCLENITIQAHRGIALEVNTVSVVLVLSDVGEDLLIYNRVLRYGRALKEIILENFTLGKNQVNLEVQALPPIYFQAVNSSEFFRAVGVNIIAPIG